MKTILYYSSNREDWAFEKKIIANIKKQSDLPVISVSQKPIDFGKNICVGDVGLSYVNEWRQILIGAKEATTEYLIFTESDFLYPKEYFDFEPKGDAGIYRYKNVFVLFNNKRSFYRKKHSEGAQIVRRDFIIDILERNLKYFPEWFDGRDIPYKSNAHRRNLHFMPYEYFNGEIPCVSFKTGDGVRFSTSTVREPGNRFSELPYWGSANNLKKEYIC